LKLKSFGDSFVYGTDLSDAANTPSKLTWPALVANQLNLEYSCLAVGGIGNSRIFNSLVYELVEYPDYQDHFYLIQWTWRDRFDYPDPKSWRWQTIRPTAEDPNAEYYYRHLHSDYQDLWLSLEHIFAAQSLLEKLNCRYIMTCLDESIMHEKVNNMKQSNYTLEIIRKLVNSKINWFEGQGFLNWSRTQGFQESPLWHPLEAAHAAAAEYAIKHWAWT
jgi:hypothetical protein